MRGLNSYYKSSNDSTIDWRVLIWTHKQLQELEDPLVCEDVKCIPCDRVNDRQTVNFVFDEGVDCIKKAGSTQKKVNHNYRQIHRKKKKEQKYLASGDMLTNGLKVA